MRLYRSHGLGNDYLVLEEGGPLSPALVRAVCHRNEGVGSDGILEPVPPREGADYGLRIHNPDGTEAEKSGNGLRIYADWLVRERGAPASFTVWTPGGVVRCAVDGPRVRVAMGRAVVGTPRELAGVTVYPVNVGNPHAVVLDIPADWEAVGARVEHAVAGRTNVQFVSFTPPSTIVARVWERGAGRTRSSGSSACAVAAVGVMLGRVATPVRVEMEGGVLNVGVAADGSVDLEGPVERVGRIEVDAEWLARGAWRQRADTSG
ncbi:MAG: diaminopimelate epimerase [Pseudomonadota bacterium]|nr:diaminopimelate epimerase [Pseudomonadota bacterium]